jgi:RNA polymerase sigma factor (sigma-70 family)
MQDDSNCNSARLGGGFPATPWTMLGISCGDDTVARRALDRICRLYWAPLYAFARRSGAEPAEAEDVTQGFFLHLLEHEVLHKAEAEKGRLRSFLSGALKLYMLGELRRSGSQKRGGNLLSTEDPALLEAQLAQTGRAGETPDETYERRWAVSLLGHTLTQLREEETKSGRGEAFTVLVDYIVKSSEARPQAEVAVELGVTENTVCVAIHRLRRRFQAVFRAQVAATVATEEEVDDEIQHLRKLFL